MKIIACKINSVKKTVVLNDIERIPLAFFLPGDFEIKKVCMQKQHQLYHRVQSQMDIPMLSNSRNHQGKEEREIE